MPRGTVVLHVSRPASFLDRHEGRTICSVARSIARLKHFDYAGPHDGVRLDAGSLFFVPDETLLRRDADALGIREAKDLYGGIVPYPFVQTKAISHGLIDPGAARPDGWSLAFAARIEDVVLPGFTAFTRDDARRAARRLLEHGAIRAKQPRAAGGNGQRTLASVREADALLAQLDADDLAMDGLVLELQLDDVTTLSLGRVTFDDTTIAYHGRQRMTRDNSGHCVYGGSDLTCVRGDWSALEARPLAAAVRTAVRQARVYDDAMSEYGVVASRRNYDVGQGADSTGRSRSGVFEASWRVGGATPAEVAALETFARDPSVDVVHASSVEAYGADAAPPDGAVVHFHGIDRDAGPVLRYSLVRGTSRRNR
jgi:hypothetical protein